jgi:hemoglobin/transferrin/lactoferrin receptor protein
LTGFTNKLKDVYFDQALVLPTGAVGKFLGSERIVSQNANGLVFVGVATAPVLVRVNYDNARLTGVEFSAEAQLSKDFTFDGNFTAIRAKSLLNGLPPNIEGGLPPPTGFISLRYQPAGSSRFYIEAYSVLAARQRRLSSLDLADRRTGAPRTRAQIANFFNRGARVHGLIGNGADGRPNTADDILIATGEILSQVQKRLLGTAGSSILYPELPGYGLVGLRGALRFAKNSALLIDFENIADKSYRGISWGIDGAGRGVTVHYRYKL